MYRILLVEDESTVREGILKKIRWEDHGFVLAGACENGRQALDIMRQAPVEAVITDINMPVMDGLVLAGEIHRGWPATKVVILTGYDDFGYAQTAIRYRVSEYILKPVTAKQLRELLDKLRAELDKSQAGDEQLRAMQRRQLLRRLLAGSIPPEELRELLREIPLAFGGGPVCVALVGPGGEETTARLQKAALTLHAQAEMLDDVSAGRVVLLCGGRAPERMAEEIVQGAAAEWEAPLCAVIGCVTDSAGCLAKSYTEVGVAWEHLYRLPPDTICTAGEILSAESAEPTLGEARRAVLRGVKLLDSMQACRGLEKFLAALEHSTWPRAVLLEQMRKLVHLLAEYADEQGIAVPAGILEYLERTGHLTQARALLASYVEEMIRAAELVGDATSRQGMLAVEYIKEHYAQPDLSLQSLTAYLSMSTSSFSVLFKNYTGATFVEFLTRLRINKAQELIASTDKKNYEIAAEIGYDDPGYFRTIFKKYTGLSPSEYRKKSRP